MRKGFGGQPSLGVPAFSTSQGSLICSPPSHGFHVLKDAAGKLNYSDYLKKDAFSQRITRIYRKSEHSVNMMPLKDKWPVPSKIIIIIPGHLGGSVPGASDS